MKTPYQGEETQREQLNPRDNQDVLVSEKG